MEKKVYARCSKKKKSCIVIPQIITKDGMYVDYETVLQINFEENDSKIGFIVKKALNLCRGTILTLDELYEQNETWPAWLKYFPEIEDLDEEYQSTIFIREENDKIRANIVFNERSSVNNPKAIKIEEISANCTDQEFGSIIRALIAQDFAAYL